MNVAVVKIYSRATEVGGDRIPGSKATLGVLHVTFMEPRGLREALLGSHVVSEWWERSCCLAWVVEIAAAVQVEADGWANSRRTPAATRAGSTLWFSCRYTTVNTIRPTHHTVGQEKWGWNCLDVYDGRKPLFSSMTLQLKLLTGRNTTNGLKRCDCASPQRRAFCGPTEGPKEGKESRTG